MEKLFKSRPELQPQAALNPTNIRRMKILVMGVSGVGKSSVATKLASKFSLPYVEADEFHTRLARQKMQRGIALEDGDRIFWLKSLGHTLNQKEEKYGGWICACSALKMSYRALLASACSYSHLVHLEAPYAYLKTRLIRQRQHRNVPIHFMPLSLLKSQFDTLQRPSALHACIINATLPLETLVEDISKTLAKISSNALSK